MVDLSGNSMSIYRREGGREELRGIGIKGQAGN